MNTSTSSPQETTPRESALDRSTAMRLAATEYGRLADLLASLTPDEWSRPTDCPGWDVRVVAGHCLGMAQMVASRRELVRQQVSSARAAKSSGRMVVDELTDLQVRKNQELTPTEVVDALHRVGPAATEGRRRLPGLVRRATFTQPVGGANEKWRMGFLTDTILTRDPWMHRVDIARATGRPMQLTPEHDGVLVADVVAEWATRHGSAYDLTLTGEAGGHWSHGSGGEVLELDAVEFCRVLSGRGSGGGLLGTEVPF